MRLLSLIANKNSFHPVFFNPTGLSLIVAKQKMPNSANKGRTYNGVGKSLLLSLVHFCLGSNKVPAFEKNLIGWEFTLEFEIDGVVYSSQRSTARQNVIRLNNESVGVLEFRSLIESKLFLWPPDYEISHFRSLVSRFMRPRHESYVSFDMTSVHETPYLKLLYNAFLLGIDLDLIVEKQRLKKERQRITDLRKSLRDDPIIKQFFTDNLDPDIELKDLIDEASYREASLRDFRVAADYHHIQETANATKRRLQELRNDSTILRNTIKSIDQSLLDRPDSNTDKVVQLYEEASIAFPGQLIKALEDVSNFHQELQLTRQRRLTSEKIRIERELRNLEGNIAELNREFDSLTRYLGEYGALDEFVQMSNYLSDVQGRIQKLRDYRELMDRYNSELQEYNIAFQNENRRGADYIRNSDALIDKNLEVFRSFSRQFYQEKPGGLIVKNNEGDNQVRFNIEAHIQDDASDGINEVKIFCFDMTLLTLSHNHKMNCLFHDSRLFSDIDPRQRSVLFRLANDVTASDTKQYIATINEDQLNSMKNEDVDQGFSSMIDNSIVLTLEDDSPESKLLGIQVDMNY